MISILIFDHHFLVRKGWAMILRTIPGFRVVGDCGDCEQAVPLVKQHTPSVILLDLDLPPLGGASLVREILSSAPQQSIIATSSVARPGHVSNVLQQGFRGYITKQAGLGELQEALHAVASGKIYLDPYALEFLRMKNSPVAMA